MSGLLTRTGAPVTHPLVKEPKGARPGAYRWTPRCSRCGGRGGSEAWSHTGWRCYECSGSGKSPTRDEPAYTPEQFAKLEARREIAAQRKAEKQAAAARALSDAAISRRPEFEAQHGQLLDDAVRANLALQALFGQPAQPFSYVTDIVESARKDSYLFEKQAGLLRSIIERHITKSHERALAEASSRHVGTVGERLKSVAVTVERLVWEGVNTFGWPHTPVYMFALRTEDGAMLMYKGAKFLGEAGTSLVISATVKEHTEFRGIAQTAISNLRTK